MTQHLSRVSDRAGGDLDEETSSSPADERIDSIWRRAYEAKSTADPCALYSDWASTHDRDHEHIGFIGHRLAAQALARDLTRRDARVLDAGAGTGAAGVALTELGFVDLTAIDPSARMLEVADRKGLYRRLNQVDLAYPVDALQPDSFDAAILDGVFSYGQALSATFDGLLRVVRPGGIVPFTMRTDFHADDPMGIADRMRELDDEGSWSLLELTDPAPALSNKDPDAEFRVWVYRVTRATTVEDEDGFAEAAHEALVTASSVKKLDPAWVWDSVASRLYDRYTESSGYYLTDCELEILDKHARDVAGDNTLIVELGCGSALKIRHVLEAAIASSPARFIRYMPIDVSQGAIDNTLAEIQADFDDAIECDPHRGLFADELGAIPEGQRKLIFFFGSTLGNVPDLDATVRFLQELHSHLRTGSRFIVGLDLHKEEDILDAAYNRDGSCRQFFVHMLRRINQSLGADFDPPVFELASTYAEEPDCRGIRTRRVNLRVSPTRDQRSYVRELQREVVIGKDDAVEV